MKPKICGAIIRAAKNPNNTKERERQERKAENMLKKQDGILILALLVAAAVFFLGYRIWNRESPEEVVVYVGEQEYARFSVGEDREFLIETENGTNRLIIKGGEADVTEATCPDKICVHQSPISETGETIVCMPNRVIVTIEQASQKRNGS